MSSVICMIHTSTKDGFTVEVKSPDGKIYQKRTSFQASRKRPEFAEQDVFQTLSIQVRILVNYGDLITAVRGNGYVYLMDGSAKFGQGHHLNVTDHDPTDSFVKTAVKVNKETVKQLYKTHPIKPPNSLSPGWGDWTTYNP